MRADEYAAASGLELAELVRSGEVAPLDLVEAAAAQAARWNPRLGAIVEPLFEAARRAVARPQEVPAGPFGGVPFLLKDLLAAVEGQSLRSGSRLLRDYRATRDSELVRRFRASGLVLVGRTATSEFGLLPFVETAIYGPARNPWDPSRTAGGSSGGSAAAVAAGIVPIAGGGDGGGSIRIPASCCGVFGLKPTRGRVPSGPDQGAVWQGAVAEHVLTRTVADSAAILDAVAGADVGAPYAAPPAPAGSFLAASRADPRPLRIAVTTRPFFGREGAVAPECRVAVEETARLLEALGHRVEAAAPEVDADLAARAFITMVAAETAAEVREAEALAGRRAGRADLELSTRALARLGGATSGGDLAMAARTLGRLGRRVGEFFTSWDALLTPTVAAPPFAIGALQPRGAERLRLELADRLGGRWMARVVDAIGEAAARTFDWIPYTPLFNVTGQPAMSVPLHWSPAGLPIGVQFAARFGDEATLFALAGQLERARPWRDWRPPFTESSR